MAGFGEGFEQTHCFVFLDGMKKFHGIATGAPGVYGFELISPSFA